MPWDWPWSSAAAHCSKGASDVPLDFCGGHQALGITRAGDEGLVGIGGRRDGSCPPFDADRRAVRVARVPDGTRTEGGEKTARLGAGAPQEASESPDQTALQPCLFGRCRVSAE